LKKEGGMDRRDRIKKRLFDREFETKKDWWGQDKTILTCEEVREKSIVMRKALAIELTMRNMPLEIKADELIVGIRTQGGAGSGRVFPTYALPEEEAWAAGYGLSPHSIWGHHPARFEVIIRKGILGIVEDIDDRIRKELCLKGPDLEKVDRLQAMRLSIGSVRCLSERYVKLLCQAAGQEEDSGRRAELFEMARVCGRVPYHPAQTFHEALQSVFFLFCALHSTMEFVPLGRVDQFLYPYYERDISEGRLTKSGAAALVSSWIAKFAEITQIRPSNFEFDRASAYDFSGGAGKGFQGFVADYSTEENYGIAYNNLLNNMIIGGLTPGGACAVNDLTYIILDEWAYLELVTPVLSVRFNKLTPPDLYERCADILRKGSGEPAIYNDEAIMKALLADGVSLEDARDYSNDGCWETLIPGKTNFQFDMVELALLLEYLLHRGHSLIRRRAEGPDLGNPSCFSTYDDFYQAFISLLGQRIRALVKNKVQHYLLRKRIAPSPLLSSVMEGCIDSAEDVYTGGAVYNFHSMILTEAATCFDSLAAIKKLVYDEGVCTMQQLAEACRCNFQGYEFLRDACLKAPKYGNDDDYVDVIAARVLHDAAGIVQEIHRSGDAGIYRIPLGVGTFEHYEQLGQGLGATPDGRLSGVAVGSNYSASIGMDTSGPTAAIRSAAKADLSRYSTSCMLDLQINANEVQGLEGLERMVGLIKGFCALGGEVLTLTGVDEKQMLDAQVHPENHKNLRVRVGGFSAYFISLSKIHQEIMIQRVKH